jgi:glc operon protein GlcG
MKTTHTIDYSEAKQIIDRIVKQALRMKKAAVIAVADSHGELIAFARMDGAPISSIRIAANKAWTAARERKSTKDIGEKARHPEKGHDIAYYGDPKFVGWGGGIPVWRDGQVVGAVAVSGLSSSEDVVLATLGIELIAGKEKEANPTRVGLAQDSQREAYNDIKGPKPGTWQRRPLLLVKSC